MSDPPRFPSKSMRAMRAEFPNAERIVQVRILMKDGAHLCIEGPVTTDEARVIVRAALGQLGRPEAVDVGGGVDEAEEMGP